MFLEINYLMLKADYKVGLTEVQFDNYHPAPAFVRQGQGDILFCYPSCVATRSPTWFVL